MQARRQAQSKSRLVWCKFIGDFSVFIQNTVANEFIKHLLGLFTAKGFIFTINQRDQLFKGKHWHFAKGYAAIFFVFFLQTGGKLIVAFVGNHG